MNMLVSTLVLGAIALVLIALAVRQDKHVEGALASWSLLWRIFPMLLLAFTVAGFVQVLMPHDLVARWLGQDAGWRGVLIGCAAGAITPGGPFVSLPIVAGLLHAGTGVGTLVAFLTSWSLWSINRLPMEVGILGWEFTLMRLASTLILPPLAGLLAAFLFGARVG